jgi:hypothetical protein
LVISIRLDFPQPGQLLLKQHAMSPVFNKKGCPEIIGSSLFSFIINALITAFSLARGLAPAPALGLVRAGAQGPGPMLLAQGLAFVWAPVLAVVQAPALPALMSRLMKGLRPCAVLVVQALAVQACNHLLPLANWAANLLHLRRDCRALRLFRRVRRDANPSSQVRQDVRYPRLERQDVSLRSRVHRDASLLHRVRRDVSCPHQERRGVRFHIRERRDANLLNRVRRDVSCPHRERRGVHFHIRERLDVSYPARRPDGCHPRRDYRRPFRVLSGLLKHAACRRYSWRIVFCLPSPPVGSCFVPALT